MATIEERERFRDLQTFITYLQTDTPFTFVKYNDGEFQCMLTRSGVNCDQDNYTVAKGIKLCRAFIYFVAKSQECKIFIGKWTDPNVTNFLEDLWTKTNQPPKNIPWCFCSVILNLGCFENDLMVQFVKSVQDSPRYKILVSNESNFPLIAFFKMNVFVKVSETNWFEYYDFIHLQVLHILEKHPHAMICCAAGMTSKILIADLHKIHSQVTFLDIGSGFDYVAGKDRRGCDRLYSRQFLLDYYKSVIPENFKL